MSATTIPRSPSAYRPTKHFVERFHDRYDDFNRHLDGEIVRRCIEDGAAEAQPDGRVYLRETFGGITYRLVVNSQQGTVVTGYPLSINTEAARDSGRWSAAEIEDVLEFLRADPR